jgi:hypothetical protein
MLSVHRKDETKASSLKSEPSITTSYELTTMEGTFMSSSTSKVVQFGNFDNVTMLTPSTTIVTENSREDAFSFQRYPLSDDSISLPRMTSYSRKGKSHLLSDPPQQKDAEDDHSKRRHSMTSFMSNHKRKRDTQVPKEQECDIQRLAQRQKQIDFGKNTLGYDTYLQQIPK